MAGARTWILDQLDAERSRWMLWLPVAMGLGIAVYFELPSEPALWLGPLVAAGALVLSFLAPSGSLARALAIGLLAAAIGLGLVAWRTASLAAPTLSRPLFSINVEGRIADIQRLPESVRVVLEAVRLKGNGVPPPEMTPVRVRVSLSKGAPPIHVGDRLLVLANLSPPAAPPGAPIEPGRPVSLNARQQQAVVVSEMKWMKDAASVQFRGIEAVQNSRGLIVVCGWVNGRNTAGKLVGFQPFVGVLMGPDEDADFVLVGIGSSDRERAEVTSLCRASGIYGVE